MVMDKRGEIKSFTDQVRVICVKNDINKPTLGAKIGMDNDAVFTAIKNNSFKPDLKAYFKLESYICGKDAHYKNKLRSKYEKTLDIQEMGDYMKASAEANNPRKVTKETHEIPKDDLDIQSGKEETIELKVRKPKNSRVDVNARMEFYNLAKDNLPEGLTPNNFIKILGHKWFPNMKDGRSYIRVEKLQLFFDKCGFKKGDGIYEKLLELELSCIAGREEEDQLALYEQIFGSNETNETKEVEEVEKEVTKETEFSDILTKWLFMHGFTLKKAAGYIGCSEEELTAVINGDIYLSPYHVNRFHETLNMEQEIVEKLVKIANQNYKGHEIPQSVLDYISSDAKIIKTLEEIISQKKDLVFWNNIYKNL